MYTIEELVAAAKQIGYSKVLVEAALRARSRQTGRDKFTLKDAKWIVKRFAEAEVRS